MTQQPKADAAGKSLDSPFLDVRNVSKYFGDFAALDDVSLSVKQGEFVSVLGPSGCGKTTLLRVIAGLESQNSGGVWINGRDVSREPIAGRELGIVFQSYALFPNISVIGNVQYGLRNLKAVARQMRAMEMLDLVGLADQASKYPAQLSGGQQQRVALARALAPNPSLLLLDEPLSALDARVRQRLRAEIRGIQEKLGVTTVMVTHDQEEALTMASRIVVMNRGKLMQYSAPRDIYALPTNAFVAGFIGAMNFLTPCCYKGTSMLECLGYVFEASGTQGCAAKVQAGDFVLAIRPEHVRVAESGDKAHNRIQTVVRHVEFRGSVSRVQLQVVRGDGVHTKSMLEMDLQPKAVDQLSLAVGRELEVYLPPKHLLVFPAEREALQAMKEREYAA
jgi:iron(III) transport system ATP-binding protein